MARCHQHSLWHRSPAPRPGKPTAGRDRTWAPLVLLGVQTLVGGGSSCHPCTARPSDRISPRLARTSSEKAQCPGVTCGEWGARPGLTLPSDKQCKPSTVPASWTRTPKSRDRRRPDWGHTARRWEKGCSAGTAGSRAPRLVTAGFLPGCAQRSPGTPGSWSRQTTGTGQNTHSLR